MKSILATAILTFFFNPLFSQIVILLDEDFNSGFPSGWQVIDNDGLTPNAQVTSITSGFGYLEDDDSTGIGDSTVACTSWFTPTGTADNYLILPQLSLENHGNILFWDVKSQDPSFPDGYEVLVSTSLPVIDSFYVDTLLFYTDAELPYWTQRSISLDDYISQDIYIAFHHFSTDKFVLKFDNIRVTADTTLSIPEIEDDLTFSVYPNPTNGILNLNLKNNVIADRIKIMNITGSVVFTSDRTNSLDISALENGIYFLEVMAGNSRGVKRLVLAK